MARWSCRRRFRPVAKKASADLRMWVSKGPNRAARRLKAGVRVLFLGKLAEKRAEEKEETLAVEAALAAEAAKAEGRALARAAAKAKVRAAWLAARAARRAAAPKATYLPQIPGVTEEPGLAPTRRQNRKWGLGPSLATVKVAGRPLDRVTANGRVIKFDEAYFARREEFRRVEAQIERLQEEGLQLSHRAKSWLRWAIAQAKTSPEVSWELGSELKRAQSNGGILGPDLDAEQAQIARANREAREGRAALKLAREADKAARQAAREAAASRRAARKAAAEDMMNDTTWGKACRETVAAGNASPIVTKRPGMGQGIAAQAVVLPVLAEYLGLGLGVAIIGILAAVAIPAFLKFITKSKTNEAGLEVDTDTDPTNSDTDGDGLCDGAIAVEDVCDAGEDLNGNGVVDHYEGYEPSEADKAMWERERQVIEMQKAAYAAECRAQDADPEMEEYPGFHFVNGEWIDEQEIAHRREMAELHSECDLAFQLSEHDGCARYEEDPTDEEVSWRKAKFDEWMQECQAEEQAAAETAHLALGAGQPWSESDVVQQFKITELGTSRVWDESQFSLYQEEKYKQYFLGLGRKDVASGLEAWLNANANNSLILPALAPMLGFDVDPLLVLAVIAMTWLISKVSPSFGGFALTLLAGATGYVVATVAGQEANSLQKEEQQGSEPHTDQEGLMVEEKEVAADRVTELLQTVKPDMEGCLRVERTAEIQATLAVASATSMVRVLLGESLDMSMTSQAMFQWPGLADDFAKQAYKFQVDSMAPNAMKARELEVKLAEVYGVSLFDLDECNLDCYKHSLHHIHRNPTSAATIEMYDIVVRALKSLKAHGDLRKVTVGELAKAWVTLNLIQTNYASEVMALNPSNEEGLYLMVNALSKTTFSTIVDKYAEDLQGKGAAPTTILTDIFLLYRNIGSEVSEVEYQGSKIMMGMELASMAYRIKEFTEAQKAAKAQKYIGQYFAPNLLGGRVVDFNRQHRLKKYGFTLKSIKDAVVIAKPVSGESIFDAETAKHLAQVYDGVVLVSRRFMALVLPSHMEEIRAGKLDGKVLIGRAYGFDFLIKGGFVIVPPQFMDCTGKDMIAYGSKGEICSTWSKDRLTTILNTGVPKSDKGACTDTQSLINGFDLRDKEVQRIFTQIKDDAVEWLKGRLEDVRSGKIQMGELDSDILDIMSTDTNDTASEETVSELRDSSRLKEILGAMAKVTGNGMALPQVIAPTMNQMTNQAMDPGRTRLPMAMYMENAKGQREYSKIALSVYPQVHYGLMISKVAEALKIELDEATKALLTGYENPMTEEELKDLVEEDLAPYGLTYDPNRNIYCNPADYKKIVDKMGTRLAFFFRNPSTITSGAWGQLVPMDCVPAGCYWVNPTPEAFTWFFSNQDGGDLDDRMVMVIGELAISCILYHEGKKKSLIAERIAPFKEENSLKASVARKFIKSQAAFMLRDDVDASIGANVTITGKHEDMIRLLTGDDAAERILKNLTRPGRVGVAQYSFKEAMTKMSTVKGAFQGGKEIKAGSALANVSRVIRSLELMKGATGTAANVQMLMGAIAQGLVHFGEGIDLDQKVRFISERGQRNLESSLTEKEAAELANLTYRDLTFFVMSEMLSNVIDADTQGQNVPEAAEVMEMIWSVSMYLGIALFCEDSPVISTTKGGITRVDFNMISLERMKFHFPGWLMKRAIGAFSAPFIGQSHMLQAGESALPGKVNRLDFAFEHTRVEGANSWVFEIFEDYMDQVLGLAHDEILSTVNDGETPAWQALELALQVHANEVKEAGSSCSKLNKLRMDGIAFIQNMKLEPKRKRAALVAAEQAWLAEWNSQFPTEKGKLLFALWTLTTLVNNAINLKGNMAFADRDSFVTSSRRSYGSIYIKGLPAHSLYVGNLLDAEGQPVVNEKGLPQGPWLYTLAALNAMATSPRIATVEVLFSFAEGYKDLQNWHFGMVNGKAGFTMENRPNPEAKSPMTTRDSFGNHNLDTEVYGTLHSEVVNKTLAEVLTSGALCVSGDSFTGKFAISKKGSFFINKRYSSWHDGNKDKAQGIEAFIEANKLQDYLVTGIEVITEKANAHKPYGHPSFNLKLQYTGPDRPLQKLNLAAYAETLKCEDSESVDYSAGPMGWHAEPEFSGFEYDDAEGVVVEDFTYSEVIEAEVVTPTQIPQDCKVLMYQGRHGEDDAREFQYWTQDETEASDYGPVVISKAINLTGMLIQKSKEGRLVYEELRNQHKAKTGTSFDLLTPGENSNLFFARVKAAGYTGISFLGGEDNRYVVTFRTKPEVTPEPPPAKAEVPAESSRRCNYGQAVITEDDNFKSKDFEFMSNMYPCPVRVCLDAVEATSVDGCTFTFEFRTEGLEGVSFNSSETLYQWYKMETLFPNEENTILPTDTGYVAKKKAKEAVKLQSQDTTGLREAPNFEDWDLIKLEVMEAILREKFIALPSRDVHYIHLPHRLYMATNGGKIVPVENNTWGDTFWGKCKGKGENHLGCTLHRISLHPDVALAARYYVKNILKKS